MLVSLVCPECRTSLARVSDHAWRCPQCPKEYPEVQGVLSFLDSKDRFNEGSYEDYQKGNWSSSAQLRSRIKDSKLLSLLNTIRIRCSLSGRRDRVFFQSMKRGSEKDLILDVGCGGGRHYLKKFGKVVGLDPVLELLFQARTIYDEVYHGGGFAMPFPDETFDYVVSSDVIGHILAADKDRLFAEMYRVLKKGGKTIHVIETDGTNPWFAFAHRYPELFQKHFVDRPGHVGLELPSQLKARFIRHGFKEVRFKKMWGSVQVVGFVVSSFDNEYKDKSKLIRALVALDRVLSTNLLVNEALNVLLEPVAQVSDVLTPLDHGAGVVVVFEK